MLATDGLSLPLDLERRRGMLTITRAPHGPLAQAQGYNLAARTVRHFPSLRCARILILPNSCNFVPLNQPRCQEPSVSRIYEIPPYIVLIDAPLGPL